MKQILWSEFHSSIHILLWNEFHNSALYTYYGTAHLLECEDRDVALQSLYSNGTSVALLT
jgi:hypothetical protein